jgi:hypothetical protein
MTHAAEIGLEQTQETDAASGLKAPAKKKGILPAIGLFFLAPLVAEYLLGNLPIKLIGALVLLAPMYGGGALLIREVVRRAGRGWPSIMLLGLAYGIFEEAFTTQSLFNPDYLHLNMHLLRPSYVPALGMGAWWTVFVLSLHMIWSVSTSIALAESAVPDRADTPWLGRVGLTITALLFALGIVGTTIVSYKHDHFVSSPAQFIGAAVACITLVIVAFRLPRRSATYATGWIPNPWLAGVIALIVCSAIQNTPSGWGWGAPATILGLELAFAAVILHWSKRTGWNMQHKLALAAGAALAYGWHSFVENPVSASTSTRIGNVIFVTGAVMLIVFAARRTRLLQTSQTQMG